jgi:hypothetical protein
MPDLFSQEESRLFPISLNRALRNIAHRRNLGKRQAAEKFQVDNLR